MSLTFIEYTINISTLSNTSGTSIITYLYNATALVRSNTTILNNTGVGLGSVFSLNITGLPNGFYYLNATVNNSHGDTNTSLSRKLLLDTGAPTLSYTCDDYDVKATQTITCTCTPTDTWDVRTTSTTWPSYTINPSTQHVGNFSLTCDATDGSGNAATQSLIYYNILAESSSGSGGGGGGSTTTVTWTNTIIATDAELSAKGPVTYELSGSSRIKVQINSQTHYIGVVSVTATTAKIQVSSTPQEATLNVGDTKKFDLNADGFYDISVTLDSITSGKAKVTTTAINEAVPAGTGTGDDTGAGTGTGDDTGAGTTGGSTGKIIMWIVIIVVIIAVVAVVIGISKNKSKSSKRWKK